MNWTWRPKRGLMVRQIKKSNDVIHYYCQPRGLCTVTQQIYSAPHLSQKSSISPVFKHNPWNFGTVFIACPKLYPSWTSYRKTIPSCHAPLGAYRSLWTNNRRLQKCTKLHNFLHDQPLRLSECSFCGMNFSPVSTDESCIDLIILTYISEDTGFIYYCPPSLYSCSIKTYYPVFHPLRHKFAPIPDQVIERFRLPQSVPSDQTQIF